MCMFLFIIVHLIQIFFANTFSRSLFLHSIFSIPFPFSIQISPLKKTIAQMMDDEWVKVASVEDSLVAELLLRLKKVNPIPPPPSASESPSTSASTPLLFKWTVRQRRSKAVVVHPKNQELRASPTTPLSFSGGGVTTSVSGGGGIAVGVDCGPEEESSGLYTRSSASKSSDVTRSKVVRSDETNKIRRSRKKKLQTLAELKAEEELLETERMQLQKELEGARDTLEKERARNDNFKRMKMASGHPAPVTLPPMVSEDVLLLQHSRPNGCSERKDEKVCKHLLPDLNLPLEENSSLLW